MLFVLNDKKNYKKIFTKLNKNLRFEKTFFVFFVF